MDSSHLRMFTLGIFAGIGMLIACFIAVSEIHGIKWQPVVVQR